MSEGGRHIALPEASPRDREVQLVVPQLVEAFAFCEALAVRSRWQREIGEMRRSHIERVYLDWREMDAESRPDFLTYAHHRRNPELAP